MKPILHQTMFMKVFINITIWALFIATSYAQPTDNVVAYYPFLGNMSDFTGNGNNCTNSGAILTSDRLGKANAAYSFNGSSNFMYLPNSLLLSSDAFSISCWIKPVGNHFSSDIYAQTIVDLRGQFQIALSYNQPSNPTSPNSIQFYIYSSPTAIVLTSPANSIQLNTWSHIVASYGNNTMTLYINGTLVGTQASNAPSACSGYNNTLGKDYAVWNDRGWVYGSIDEVIIYKQNLTSNDVQAIYNRELTANEIPEICAPIKYTYDYSGNRTDRNIVLLKSTPNIVQTDSTGQAFSIPGEKLEDNLGEQKVVIYPNPTQGQVLVEIQGYGKETNTALYLYDLTGKLLISKKPANSNMSLDLTGYPIGPYVLKIMLGDKISEWKIIKE